MKHFGLVIVLFSIVFFPSFCFAFPRQEIIDEALTEQENASNISTEIPQTHDPYQPPKPYLDENKRFFGDPVKAELTPWMSTERKKAIDETLSAFSISAGFDYNHMHYSEWSGSRKLDEDFGYQDGFYADLGYKSAHYSELIKSRPFANFYYKEYNNMILYKGATIGPPSIPVSMDERSKIEIMGLKLGGYRDLFEKCDFFGYIDFGRRIWHRGETKGSNYYERYKWAYYGPGVGFNYKLLPKLSLGIEAKLMFGISPEMWADLYEGGTFRLHDVNGGEISIPLKYYLLKNLSLDLTPYCTFWNIGESDPVTISGSPYVEPDSKTHEEGLMFGLSYIF
jgi:hypothetical protein